MSKTPKLRFKEFSGDWESKKINEIYKDLKAGSTPSKSVPRYFRGDIPWITSGELKTKYIYKTNEYITDEAVNSANLKIYDEGTFFIAITGLEAPGTRGSCGINKVKATTNQSCLAFQKNSKMNSEFLYYWYLLNGEYIGITYTQGTKQQSLNNELVGKLRINIPSKEEQEKIASFFSLIDDKISLQGEKVEALKDYKKGMMQKIFSRELRFKDDDGRDYPEWEEKKLGDICTFFSGGTPLTSKSSYYNGDIPFIRSAEISGEKTELTISEEGLNSSSAKMVQKGDLLYALYGATSGEVSISKIDGAINQAILCIKSDNVDLSFIEKILRINKETIINTYLQGGQGNLSANIIKGLKYLIPHLNEQKKISNFLDHLDTRIEKEQEKLDSFNEYKKGLLQQMFV